MALIKVEGLAEGSRRCEYGFLGDYIDWTKGQESPEDYHIWTALSIVSCALGRKCFIDKKYFKLYPNLLVLLIGESAFLRKSTAIRMGIKLLKKASPDLNFFSQKITPEAMIGNLHNRHEATGTSDAIIFASEFASFFGKTKIDPSLIDIITDLYDSEDVWSYETRGRGVETCNNVCLNMIAGSTPEWMKRSLPEEMLAGGFFSRLLPVFRTEARSRNAFPEDDDDPEQRIFWDNCRHDLTDISLMKGAFRWTPEAKEIYATWYSDIDEQMLSSDFTKGYYGRKQDFIQKIAMLCSACESSQMLITDKNILFALTLLSENERYMKTLTSQMAQTQQGASTERVFLKIKRLYRNSPQVDGKRQSVLYSALLRNCSAQMNSRELKEIVASLAEEKKILIDRTEGKRGFRIDLPDSEKADLDSEID